ncbi:ribonuclease H family protein [Bifidobacterium moukalabense]|uniref:ribonuclease H family protein n=1 Tax=Bifidobacterium moukalabense TaxID=1333651 RepID=UPI0010F510D5|nr:ribonuclease H [Bifidobacterium moukalabense]
MTITVSTDGSALGNPNGPMGWGWADHDLNAGGTPGHEHTGDCDAGGATNGTNQIGELCAVLEALRAHPGSEPLVIETDSQYAINCSTKWVHGWKRNGWKNSQKKPVKNAALIKAIDAELSKRPGSVKFVWVKGHAGNAGNEKVDELARTYADDCRSKVREGYLPLEGWQSLLASEYSQGTDVPEDARMLLDGAISTAEYHLGRGESGTTPLSGESTKSIADMLVEPEGYPAPEPVEEPTEALVAEEPTRPIETETAAETPRKSLAELLVRPDHFPKEDDGTPVTEDDGIETTVLQRNAESATTSMPQSRDTDDSQAPVVSNLPKPPHRPSPSGLAVSGTIRFTPPPESSPTFDGKPRLIRGYIAVEGYVTGDGTLVLDDAPFSVKHA